MKIELPKVASEALASDTRQHIVTLSVKAQGGYYWNLGDTVDTQVQTDQAASLEDMQERIARLVAERKDTQVFIRADDKADYGRVVAAMAALQRSGVTQLGLVTEAPQ